MYTGTDTASDHGTVWRLRHCNYNDRKCMSVVIFPLVLCVSHGGSCCMDCMQTAETILEETCQSSSDRAPVQTTVPLKISLIKAALGRSNSLAVLHHR